jgi:hypothetical protein
MYHISVITCSTDQKYQSRKVNNMIIGRVPDDSCQQRSRAVEPISMQHKASLSTNVLRNPMLDTCLSHP